MCLLSNALYCLAGISYWYNTYLGFRSLPFIGKAQVFLFYPSAAAVLLLVLAMISSSLGLNIHATRAVMAFHYA
jgi:hypothetical protein